MSDLPRCWVETEDGGVRPSSLLEFIRLYDGDQWHRRRVGRDEGPGVRVSTVFLGLDHGHHHGEPNASPVLYETLVSGADGEGLDSDRYHTREEALAGHEAMCLKYLGRKPEKTP